MIRPGSRIYCDVAGAGEPILTLHGFPELGLAFGTVNCAKNLFSAMGHMCGNGAHTAGEMIHNSMNTHPDLEHAEYAMIVGAAIGEAYQGAVAYGRIMGDAQEHKNFRLVVVDPQQSRAAAMADEWVPIRPATDGALFLAMMHVLVHEIGIYDAEYLRVHTNAGYLIGTDGYPLREADTGKPIMWDLIGQRSAAYDDPALSLGNIALLGRFETPYGEGRPGSQLLHESI